MISRRARLGDDSRRPRSGADRSPAASGPAGRRPGRSRLPERAAYWLLYIVALPAAVLHWRAGNEELAALCALAAAAGIALIAAAHRRV
ncbi:hypothetical protein FZ103_19860 [Streptomonospora sp. PA3]|uniref:hypothetical protein n=1 Tax=Streptomonospora sp. PA3 TaxID=2607326 RepID=UPI0012DDBE5C|nr:hypothetical protein [Streptomonospora sp. PA3]MUL43397.1 hypothetical protein [Streptomonospora sp. PA3]